MRSDPVPAGRATKPVYSGQLAKGRVKQLWGGQGSGIISASRGDVFFHKSDVNGTYWDLKVGVPVVFELLDDPISGPRAQNVRLAPGRKMAVK
jgi:cold shock CspA family protein